MGTIAEFKINGQTKLPPIEWQELEVSATFDNDSVQANINFSTLNFVDQSNEIIKDWFINNVGATEGIPFEISVNDTDANGQTIYVPFTGYLDWSTYKVKASNRSEMSLVKTDSLNGLFERSKGITMLLLEMKGVMPKSDGVNIPYVIANRNTKLENIMLVYNTFITFKTIVDETFKLIVLLAQLPTGGNPIAVFNIVTTVANLVLLINKLLEMLTELQDVFLPPIRLHRGIKLKTFLERGCQYMGYTLDTGSFGAILDGVNLCPHKTDEIGVTTGLFGGNTSNINNNISGILKPNDFGYVLSEAFELCNRMFYTKIAVSGSVVTLKPFNDPSWTNTPSYTMPDIKVEDDPFHSNGVQTFNVDELMGRTLISYQFDDSDKWSISNVNNSISETIVTPITVINQKNVTVKGLDDVNIPYVLAIRTAEPTEIIEKFVTLVNFVNDQVQVISDVFATVAGAFGQTLDPFNSFAIDLTARENTIKIENHFFSSPKIVWLENGQVPANFIDKIGAIALYNNYHSYKSFVSGIKNPNNINETNQKKVFRDVEIPFGASSFSQIINNSFFNDVNGNLGKFTSISWNIDKDTAVVSYYVFENYINNLIETTI